MKLNELIDDISANFNKINFILGEVDIHLIGQLILDKTREIKEVNNITYIEDPEYKQYYKKFHNISENIINHTDLNKQNVLIVTQSLEFVDSMLYIAEDKNILDNISIFTIKKENDNKEFFCRKLFGTRALKSRDTYDLDLRS